jgi:eukaryotic-like serine/threonine-protein kinase
MLLSHYEILSKIGAGGMGEVFRARDTRLGRTVAIKILPEAFAQDRERLARFQREAQLLASLNHPNIASLYGFEEADGKPFLVMELAEGESLDRVLEHGPLSLEDTLGIAHQVALALEEAHERGIVHRDLKPGNIQVGPDLKVKVLDFGLAKALEADTGTGSGALLTQSPTITRMTGANVILGTAAYMSPEQARGKPADRRSDIWSFGVVLLEMLTGRRVFEGESITETLAAIMKDAVPWDRLPANLPPALPSLLQRCLERDPRRRLQAVGEARIALETLIGGPAVSGSSPAMSGVIVAPVPVIPRGSKIPALVPWVVAALGLALGAIGFLRESSHEGVSALPVRKFQFATKSAGTASVSQDRSPFSISPRGDRVTYVDKGGLWVRDLNALEPRSLVVQSGSNPEDAPSSPAWSPDGRQIVYGASGRLWRIPVEGGSPAAICTPPSGFFGPTWLSGDRIVFSVTRGDLYQVSAMGGDPKVLIPRTQADVDFHETWALPGDKGIIYALHRQEGVDTIELFAGGKRRVLLRVAKQDATQTQVVNNVCYAPGLRSSEGYLVYQRDEGNRGIWAVPFSLQKLAVTGEPFLAAAYGTNPSVSEDGTLVYQPGSGDLPGRLVWVKLDGTVDVAIGDPLRGLASPVLSPDGTRVAYVADENGSGEIWVQDLAHGTRTRLTFTPEDESAPQWIPGQDKVAFNVTKEGHTNISARAADGSGETKALVEDAGTFTFTPDGREIVYQQFGVQGNLMRRLLDGSKEPEILVPGSNSNLYSPLLSSDGRFLSYISWERGTATTYIRPYPTGDGKWELAESSESQLCWHGDHIFYRVFGSEPGLAMTTATVGEGGALSLSTPKTLFKLNPSHLAYYRGFDVSRDNSRVLMVQNIGDDQSSNGAVVVENWLAEFATKKH